MPTNEPTLPAAAQRPTPIAYLFRHRVYGEEDWSRDPAWRSLDEWERIPLYANPLTLAFGADNE